MRRSSTPLPFIRDDGGDEPEHLDRRGNDTNGQVSGGRGLGDDYARETDNNDRGSDDVFRTDRIGGAREA